MEPTPQTPSQPTIILPPASSPGIVSTRTPSSVAFLAGILLFLLPFAEIKCGGTVVAKNTGLGIAIGKNWESVSGKSMFGTNDDNNNTKNNTKEKQDPNMYAIVALSLGVLGLVLSFANAKTAIGSALLTGILAAGAMIGLMLDLQKKVKTDMGNNTPKSDGGGWLGLDKLNNVKMTIDFTPWFYIAVIAFLAAAFFSYRRITASKTQIS